MPIFASLSLMSPFDTQRAAFITHLNYIKCLVKSLEGVSLTVSKRGTFVENTLEIQKFRKLFKLTKKSLDKDIELAREDPAFSVIIAPWFPVKCYYALYYLESILLNLSDGSENGFTRGGHTGVRKVICSHIRTNLFRFSSTDISSVYTLLDIDVFPSIPSGSNTSARYWENPQCKKSLLKKLKDYKLHNQKVSRNWNFRKSSHRQERDQFISRENICMLDFFYWYRIKANYRDLDYIDFENGISESEVLEYIEAYNKAFELYRELLVGEIKRILGVTSI